MFARSATTGACSKTLFSLENSFSNIVCGPDFAAAFGTLAVMLGTSSTAICRDFCLSRAARHISRFLPAMRRSLAVRNEGTGSSTETLSKPAGMPNMIEGLSLSVFLVEDEVLIRMMVADMLEELGHRVVAEAGDLSRAMKLAQSAVFDLAILDVNLHGEMSFPVAEAIKARQLPLIFSSGYEAKMAPNQYCGLLDDRFHETCIMEPMG